MELQLPLLSNFLRQVLKNVDESHDSPIAKYLLKVDTLIEGYNQLTEV